MNEKELLTVDETMHILNLGRNTVYNMLRSGEIKAIRFGRLWRIPKTSLDSILSVDFNKHNMP